MGSVEESIIKQFNESILVKKSICQDRTTIAYIANMAEVAFTALKSGKKIFFAGNGGSFADALHLTAEFVGRFRVNRIPLAAICLGANNSTLTAVGNDYSYADVFARELQALGQVGDVFIGISTSGNSENIIRAIKIAQEKELTIFALTGKTGGKMASVTSCITVPSTNTARIQETHISIGHILCDLVETKIIQNMNENGE